MAINKKTGRRKPKPTIGKTVKDTQLVRFIDLNQYVDEIVDFSEGEFIVAPESPNNGDSLLYNSATEEWATHNDGQNPVNTKIVEISSNEILNLHTTPVELLPALGTDKYYVFSEIQARYLFGSTDYSSFDSDSLMIAEQASWTTDSFIRAITVDRHQAFFFKDLTLSAGQLSQTTPVVLELDEGFPLTGGDGIIKVKLVYRIIDTVF